MTHKRARDVLNIAPLEPRKTELILRFAKIQETNQNLLFVFLLFFKLNRKTNNIKTKNPINFNIQANTEIYQRSPILYMNKLIN